MASAFNWRQGYKAPTFGRPRAKAPPYRATDPQIAALLGSSGIRPTAYSAWTNTTAFNDWKTGLKPDDPRRNWKFDPDANVDGDGIPDGVVTDENGRIVGVNGFRIQPSNWGSRTHFKQNSDGSWENRYKTRYEDRKKWNEENGVTSLKGVRQTMLLKYVKPFMEGTYAKGSVQRKVPRSGIVARLIAHFGGGDLDNAFLQANAKQLAADGYTPADALSRYHKSAEFRTALVASLNNHFGPDGQISTDAQNVIKQYVTWYTSH